MTLILPPEFYRRDTAQVARELVGQRLCRRLDDGRLLTALIVETEAYLGLNDPACHSYGGRHTPRTRVLYEPGGVAYLYLIYGLHWCLNLVTGAAGQPEAVLIRAAMAENHPEHYQDLWPSQPPARWLSGPGKVCRGLVLGREQNGQPPDREPFWLEASGQRPALVERTRIGVGYAGAAAQWSLRFCWRDHPSLSRK